MTPCALATRYYEKMSKCKTIAELQAVGMEIKADLNNLAGFEDWLRSGYQSCADTIKAPEFKPEEALNKEGIKAWKRGEL